MNRRPGPVLTVSLEVEGDEAAPHQIALGSLASRFSAVDAGRMADVRVVGSAPGSWPAFAEAALQREARAIVVAGRAQADEAHVSRLLAHAESAGVAIAVATPFAGARNWRASEGRIRTEASSASIVDSVMMWSGDDEQAGSRALLDQLAVIGGIVTDLDGLRVASATPAHYVVAGMAGRVAVVLSGSRCSVDAPRLRVDVVGTGSRWRASFDGTSPARPAVIERCSEERIDTRPLGFESGYRAAWIDLYQHLVRRARLPAYLSIDHRHLALARAVYPVVISG